MSIFDQTSSLFSDKFNPKPAATADSAAQKPKLDLFGSMNLQPPKPTSSGLFNTTTPSQPQSSGLFGAPASAPASQPQTSGLFGNTTTQPATGGGSSLFGAPPATQAQSTGGLFGSTQQNTQQGGGLFGAPKPAQQGSGLFGSTQPAQQGGGLFGNTQTAQPQQSNSIFGAAQSQPQQQQQQQQQQAQGSVLGAQPTVLISQSQLFPPIDSSPRKLPPPSLSPSSFIILTEHTVQATNPSPNKSSSHTRNGIPLPRTQVSAPTSTIPSPKIPLHSMGPVPPTTRKNGRQP